jgi:glucose/arabinose dehydrogenase
MSAFTPRLLGAVFALTTAFSHPAAAAASLKLVTSGLTQPIFATSAGDARLFVAEQGGRIAIVGATGTTTFMTVPNIATGGEKGLLGLAFDPQFATNGRFYVNVIASNKQGQLVTQIRRYTRLAGNPNAGDPLSEQVLLQFKQPFENHNGGWIGFGRDGFLYIASGDGGSGNDPLNNAQRRSNLLGKILRIDVSGASGYTIPASNPFKAGRREIFAFGLRNPFRSSFDRTTGDLYIADVGQGAREEISVIRSGTSGQNFGWRVREGSIATPGITGVTKPTMVPPIYDYSHGSDTSAGQGNSVTGGYVYRGPIPALAGRYVFGDFISGGLWSIKTDGTGFSNMTAMLTPFGGANISSFGEGNDGTLYLVDYRGRLFKFEL